MRKGGTETAPMLRELCLLGGGWELPRGYETELHAKGVSLRMGSVEGECENCLFLTWDVPLCRRLLGEGRAAVLAVKEDGLETLPWDIPQVVTEPFSLTVWELERLFRRQRGVPLVIAETERLLVREAVLEDLETLRRIYREEEKNPYIFPLFGGRIDVGGLADYRRAQYEFYGFGMWSLCLRQSGEVIGWLGFACGAKLGLLELGYLVDSRFRRQGYAKEAAARLLSLAKEQSWGDRVEIRTGTEMKPSRRLADALGFHLLENSQGICIYERSLN